MLERIDALEGEVRFLKSLPCIAADLAAIRKAEAEARVKAAEEAKAKEDSDREKALQVSRQAAIDADKREGRAPPEFVEPEPRADNRVSL
jgi:hypothetical protein